MNTPGDIIDFWLGDARRDAEAAQGRNALWFGRDEALDRSIRKRFGDDIAEASDGRLPNWEAHAEGTLALVILLDQFRRNIFRGTPEAFSQDPRALALTEQAMARGHDRELHPVERVFLYMPLEHAESLEVQIRSVHTFAALAASVPAAQRPLFEGFAKYARLHHDIVERFGRFPHRNGILGRRSTPEEQAYLDADAPSFGQ